MRRWHHGCSSRGSKAVGCTAALAEALSDTCKWKRLPDCSLSRQNPTSQHKSRSTCHAICCELHIRVTSYLDFCLGVVVFFILKLPQFSRFCTLQKFCCLGSSSYAPSYAYCVVNFALLFSASVNIPCLQLNSILLFWCWQQTRVLFSHCTQ